MATARGDHSQLFLRTPQDMEASLASLTYSPSPRLQGPQEFGIEGASPTRRLHQPNGVLSDYSFEHPTQGPLSPSPPPPPPPQQQQSLNSCQASSSFLCRRALQPAVVSLPSLKELPSLSPPLGCPRRRTSPDSSTSSRTDACRSETVGFAEGVTHLDLMEHNCQGKAPENTEAAFVSAPALRMLRNVRLTRPTESAGFEGENGGSQSTSTPAWASMEQVGNRTQDETTCGRTEANGTASRATDAANESTGAENQASQCFRPSSFFNLPNARNGKTLGSSTAANTAFLPINRNADSVKSDIHPIGGTARSSPALEPTARCNTPWPPEDLPLLRDARAPFSGPATADLLIEFPSDKSKKGERNEGVASSPTDSPLLVNLRKPDTRTTGRDTACYPITEICQSRCVTSSPVSRRHWVAEAELSSTQPAESPPLKRGYAPERSPLRDPLEAVHREDRLDKRNNHPSSFNVSSSYSSASSSACSSTASSSSVSPNSSTASSRNQHSGPPTGAPLSPRCLDMELKELETQCKKQAQGGLWDHVRRVLDRHLEYIAFQGDLAEKERARVRRLEADLAACAAVLQLRRRDAAYTPALACRLTATSRKNDTGRASSDAVFDPKSDTASLRAVAERHVELFRESEYLLEKTQEKLDNVEERLLEAETDRDFLERECAALKKQLATTRANEERAQVALREARLVALNDRQALEARHRDTVAELRDLLHQEAAKNENLEEQLSTLTRGAHRERMCENEVQDLLEKEKNLRGALQLQEEELSRLREVQSQKETASLDELEFWTEKAHHFETLLQSEMARAKALEQALEAAHSQIRQLEADLSDADLEVTRVEEAGKGKLLQVEMNLRTHMEDLEQQLEEEKKDRERELFGTRDIQVALEREIGTLRSDCRKWQKLLRQKEAEIHVLKDNMKKNMEELHGKQEKVIAEKLAEREAVLRSQLDSVVELRANDHFLVLRSKYEKHIAKLKQKVQTLLDQKASGKGKIKSLIQEEVSKAVAHSIGSLEASTRPVSGTQSLNPTTSSAGTLQFLQAFKEPDPQTFTAGCLESYEPSRGKFVGSSMLVGTASMLSTAKESAGTTVLGLTEENLERLERHLQNAECATSNFHPTVCTSAVNPISTPHRGRRSSSVNTPMRSSAVPVAPLASECSVAAPTKHVNSTTTTTTTTVTPPRRQTQYTTSSVNGSRFSVHGSLPGPTSHWTPLSANALSVHPEKRSSMDTHAAAASDTRQDREDWVTGFSTHAAERPAGRLHRLQGASFVNLSPEDRRTQQHRTRSLASSPPVQSTSDSPHHHFLHTKEAPGHHTSLSWGRQRVSRSIKTLPLRNSG